MRPEIEQLRRALRDQGVTQRECATLLHLSPSNVSRRISGEVPFTRSELGKLDTHLNLGGRLLDLAGYKVAAFTPARVTREARNLPAEYWMSHFERHLRVLDEPKADVVLLANLTELAEDQLRATPSSSERVLLGRAVAIGKLAQAWSLTNTVGVEDLGIPIELAESISAQHSDKEIRVLATYIAECSRRMRSEHDVNPDAVERLAADAAACRPLVAGFLFEEIAKQRMHAGATTKAVSEAVERSRYHYSLDQRLVGKAMGVSAVLSRATWLNSKNPKQGAAMLRSLVDRLGPLASYEPDLVLGARAYEGAMLLEAGDESAGSSALTSALRQAIQMGNSYFVEWITGRASAHRVAVN